MVQSPKMPRIWDQKGFFPFCLEPLTPVTIGSGEDLSPLDYVIRKQGESYVLHLVNTQDWLSDMHEKSDIQNALNNGNILRLRVLMDEFLDEKVYSIGSIPIHLNALAEQVHGRIKNPQSLSKAEIQPFIRNDFTMTAFVPGSSLKGALSTPLIDDLDHGKIKNFVNRSGSRNAYMYALKDMFGEITEHSMQALKVSDIPVPMGGTYLVAAKEVKRSVERQSTPKVPCEALRPLSEGGRPLYGHLHMATVNGVPTLLMPNGQKYSVERLNEICNKFYSTRYHNEMANFYKLSHLQQVSRQLESVTERIEHLKKGEFLLRLGHYSHIECVTVTQNDPKLKKGYGKTRTLADGILPFGWVILRICDKDEYVAQLEKIEKEISKNCSEYRIRREERLVALEKRLQQEELKRQEIEKKRKEEEDARAKEEEAKAREAEFMASLSPEERMIYAVQQPSATEAQSMELFSQIESLEGESRLKAAQALKDCWQRLKKWDGKLSKKQAVKVKVVMEILNATSS